MARAGLGGKNISSKTDVLLAGSALVKAWDQYKVPIAKLAISCRRVESIIKCRPPTGNGTCSITPITVYIFQQISTCRWRSVLNGSTADGYYKVAGLLDVEDVGGGFSAGLYIKKGLADTHLHPRWQ